MAAATGYIGGSILGRLLSHPDASKFEITVIVRSEVKAKKLKTFGVKAIVGSFKTDLELVEKLAEAAHIVFHSADADDVPAVHAILTGLRKRHAQLKDLPILIHTSGIGVFTVNDKIVYDDTDVVTINNLPPDAPHRPVDLAVIQADKEGYVRTYIVLPGTIYGLAANPLVAAGIANAHSVALPALIKISLARGRAGMLGKGMGVWSNVHIDDSTDFYIILFDALLRNPEAVEHGANGYYFTENGEHSWYELAKAVGSALVELGVQSEDEPKAFEDEELVKFFGSVERAQIAGTTSRVRATHSRALGWKPKYTRENLFKSIKPEVEVLLKQYQQQQ